MDVDMPSNALIPQQNWNMLNSRILLWLSTSAHTTSGIGIKFTMTWYWHPMDGKGLGGYDDDWYPKAISDIAGWTITVDHYW